MMAKSTIDWMEKENMLKHWILPEQGLNDGTRYSKAPVGNAPELNALDSNCNRDIHCAILEHDCMTSYMQDTDNEKFSVNSPLNQDRAYLRLWDPHLQINHTMKWEAGVPSSTRIMEDMMRIPKYSIIKRFNARGCVVPGCGTRRGRRDDGIREVSKWGGERERKGWSKKIHPSRCRSWIGEFFQSLR